LQRLGALPNCDLDTAARACDGKPTDVAAGAAERDAHAAADGRLLDAAPQRLAFEGAADRESAAERLGLIA
jgi:hypothetical protein